MRRGTKARIIGRFTGPLSRYALAGALLIGLTAAAEARRASIVVDANTGEVLQESAADAPRFPASLTKVMTLYMLFEQLEAGRFTLNSRLPVSSRAAAQPPSKLWLEDGSTIRVEDAILALVTRSANDVAMVVAEAVGGSEEVFAQRMTARARQIGMRSTTFRNASGLPNPAQVSTARDLALLGRAVYERFPQYKHFFSRRSFAYEGEHIRNHNRLLGRIQGIDGIKTGYTRASGFNLLTSARVDGRHVVAVVLGGTTGRSRDQQMATLVQRHIRQASATRQVDRAFVARLRRPDAEVAAAPAQAPRPTAEERVVARAAQGAPIALAPTPAEPRELVPQAPVRVASAAGPTVPAMRWHTGPQPAAQAQSAPAAPVTAAVQPRPTAAAVTGWVIQIAATSSEAEARKMLAEAKEAARRPLAGAQPVTEQVTRGGATLVRARFAGFADRAQADAACAVLKRNDFDCMAIRL